MNRLRELRREKGLTMKQLGNFFGLAESTISQYETGKRQPDNETLIKFANYFDVTIDFLLGNDSSSKQKKEPVTDRDRLLEDNIELFKKLPTDKKKQALDYLRYLVEHQGKQ
ncbi:HTH-type transcriptional regulator Xre [Caprobacter fermentans]|uniref:HTH-type transcriptional regulator Xre n=1 Tax=Caproicibacter fermentans TaxID=2576756 RepID=A0A6N8HZ58_9FIRM|nr:helix-turn-helix transcriptional regulator [Caproicibacter fermentans]MVB11052.1 HTH-type transcriptional regulator Xre [Caproicibacter fermentans]